MSTETSPFAQTNGHGRALSGVRTYRGRNLDDVLPQIHAELGADAVILRQRDGLVGGVGGFFTQKCIEVEARAANGHGHEDSEDEPTQVLAPASVPAPEPMPDFARATVPTPEPTPDFAPAAAQLAVAPSRAPAARTSIEPEPAASILPPAYAWAARQAGAPEAGEADAVVDELIAQGISEEWAHELVVAASAHRTPLVAAGSLRDAVRGVLAATIPAPAPLPTAGAVVAFVGPGGVGKTHCTAALAAAYARGSSLAASVVSLGGRDWGSDVKELLGRENVWVTVAPGPAEAQEAVTSGRDGGLVVIDTATVSPADAVAVAQLAADLRSLNVDAIYVAVPATFSVRAARKLMGALEALGADGLAVTHVDGSDQLGVAAELAYWSGMPVAYMHQGTALHGSVSAADPALLAARLLP